MERKMGHILSRLLKREHREEGQTSTEYVLVILGVVLFLVFAAFALNGIVDGAVTRVDNWIDHLEVSPPPVP